ncbi:hypothetical protein H4219_001004 [Mycoemilia scoparia]|uniref:U6 snRNA-associated Sm-like protein LSm1 n=1 Tax=Mycoemilia scoparia TaxID=417184 RepID=A0A9W8A281_9FUNG|nr:hypothetical protein H4219_001004 [Mycoemilia scoparia]
MNNLNLENFFTTGQSLQPYLDKDLLVVLRDGRKLLGILRSYDQFANLVLQDTIERIYVNNSFGDIERGIYIVRGENVVLLGEVDKDAEDDLDLQELPIEQILQMQKEEADEKARKEKIRLQLLHKQGFSVDFVETDMY